QQHLTRAAAAAHTRTQRPGKHLAVHASELVVKPDFQILRRYRRPLLLRLEHSHRPTLEDYVHRATQLGSSRSLNLRISISVDWALHPTRLCPAPAWLVSGLNYEAWTFFSRVLKRSAYVILRREWLYHSKFGLK